MVDDRALARALAAGDPAAFHAFVDEQATPVLRTCYRILGSLEEAEDATQEAFVLAYRALATYRGDGPPAAWIARIATRECWRRRARGVRRRALTVPLDDVTATTLPDPADPARDVLSAERAAAVRDAVAALPEPYREVVALRYFGELSVAAIASTTGRPEGTVKAQLHRGLERLRGRLDEVAS
jgi:RNA polymerase sigma-70 factor (ECF subfamily)